jgi:hypothetical protein
MPFKPGNNANPKGRPKGSKNKAVSIRVKDLNAAVSARATDMLEAMLGKATDVIDEALDDGNAQVAMWMYDRLISKTNSLLPEAIDIKLSTMDDVMLAAEGVIGMAMLRKLSIDDATKSLNMLSQYAAFRAFERIDELRAMVDEMKRQSEAKTVEGHAVVPQWGRLSEQTPTANVKPAE